MLATRRRDIAAIAYGFMASKALFAALEIGLFSLLADGPRTSAALAAETGVAPNRLGTLLRALVALGLLIADDEGFRNAPAAQRHLVRGARADIGEYYRLQVGRQIYPALTHLDAGIAGHGRRVRRVRRADGQRGRGGDVHGRPALRARWSWPASSSTQLPLAQAPHAARRRRGQRGVRDRVLRAPPRAAGHAAGLPADARRRPHVPGRRGPHRPHRADPRQRHQHRLARRAGRRADVVPAQRADRGRGRRGPRRRAPQPAPRRAAGRPRLHARRRRARPRPRRRCGSCSTWPGGRTRGRSPAPSWATRMAKAGFLPTPAEQVVPETTKLVLARKGEDR